MQTHETLFILITLWYLLQTFTQPLYYILILK